MKPNYFFYLQMKEDFKLKSPFVPIGSSDQPLSFFQVDSNRALAIDAEGQLQELPLTQDRIINTPKYLMYSLKILKLKFNDSISIGIDMNGCVVSWGFSSEGVLGLGGLVKADNPTLIKGLNGIVDISISKYHCICLDSSGQAYSWGTGKYGELCTEKIIYSPEPIKLQNRYCYVSCGDFITVLIDEENCFKYYGLILDTSLKDEMSEINWIKYINSKTNDDIFKEKKIMELAEEQIKTVLVGNSFIALLSHRGIVYILDDQDLLTLLFSQYYVNSITVGKDYIAGIAVVNENTEKTKIFKTLNQTNYFAATEEDDAERKERRYFNLWMRKEDSKKQDLRQSNFNFKEFSPQFNWTNYLFKIVEGTIGINRDGKLFEAYSGLFNNAIEITNHSKNNKILVFKLALGGDNINSGSISISNNVSENNSNDISKISRLSKVSASRKKKTGDLSIIEGGCVSSGKHKVNCIDKGFDKQERFDKTTSEELISSINENSAYLPKIILLVKFDSNYNIKYQKNNKEVNLISLKNLQLKRKKNKEIIEFDKIDREFKEYNEVKEIGNNQVKVRFSGRNEKDKNDKIGRESWNRRMKGEIYAEDGFEKFDRFDRNSIISDLDGSFFLSGLKDKDKEDKFDREDEDYWKEGLKEIGLKGKGSGSIKSVEGKIEVSEHSEIKPNLYNRYKSSSEIKYDDANDNEQRKELNIFNQVNVEFTEPAQNDLNEEGGKLSFGDNWTNKLQILPEQDQVQVREVEEHTFTKKIVPKSSILSKNKPLKNSLQLTSTKESETINIFSRIKDLTTIDSHNLNEAFTLREPIRIDSMNYNKSPEMKKDKRLTSNRYNAAIEKNFTFNKDKGYKDIIKDNGNKKEFAYKTNNNSNNFNKESLNSERLSNDTLRDSLRDEYKALAKDELSHINQNASLNSINKTSSFNNNHSIEFGSMKKPVQMNTNSILLQSTQFPPSKNTANASVNQTLHKQFINTNPPTNKSFTSNTLSNSIAILGSKQNKLNLTEMIISSEERIWVKTLTNVITRQLKQKSNMKCGFNAIFFHGRDLLLFKLFMTTESKNIFLLCKAKFFHLSKVISKENQIVSFINTLLKIVKPIFSHLKHRMKIKAIKTKHIRGFLSHIGSLFTMKNTNYYFNKLKDHWIFISKINSYCQFTETLQSVLVHETIQHDPIQIGTISTSLYNLKYQYQLQKEFFVLLKKFVLRKMIFLKNLTVIEEIVVGRFNEIKSFIFNLFKRNAIRVVILEKLILKKEFKYGFMLRKSFAKFKRNILLWKFEDLNIGIDNRYDYETSAYKKDINQIKTISANGTTKGVKGTIIKDGLKDITHEKTKVMNDKLENFALKIKKVFERKWFNFIVGEKINNLIVRSNTYQIKPLFKKRAIVSDLLIYSNKTNDNLTHKNSNINTNYKNNLTINNTLDNNTNTNNPNEQFNYSPLTTQIFVKTKPINNSNQSTVNNIKYINQNKEQINDIDNNLNNKSYTIRNSYYPLNQNEDLFLAYKSQNQLNQSYTDLYQNDIKNKVISSDSNTANSINIAKHQQHNFSKTNSKFSSVNYTNCTNSDLNNQVYQNPKLYQISSITENNYKYTQNYKNQIYPKSSNQISNAYQANLISIPVTSFPSTITNPIYQKTSNIPNQKSYHHKSIKQIKTLKSLTTNRVLNTKPNKKNIINHSSEEDSNSSNVSHLTHLSHLSSLSKVNVQKNIQTTPDGLFSRKETEMYINQPDINKMLININSQILEIKKDFKTYLIEGGARSETSNFRGSGIEIRYLKTEVESNKDIYSHCYRQFFMILSKLLTRMFLRIPFHIIKQRKTRFIYFGLKFMKKVFLRRKFFNYLKFFKRMIKRSVGFKGKEN